MHENLKPIIAALAEALPPVMRWSGAVAKRLRQFNIAVEGKSSGNSNTDALTLADLSVQEFLVAALRDADPILKSCRIEGEESTGDMDLFSKDAKLSIALDPIDGTKQYRDRSGNGYSIIAHLHDDETPYYSLVFAPEMGESGTWVEVGPDRLRCGEDDTTRTARQVLDDLPDLRNARNADAKGIYLIGFQERDAECARMVDELGLMGRTSSEMAGSIYPLMATGEYAGSLIHSPNIYDFPVSMHIARLLGGDAVWAHNGKPVHYRELWMDDRADMLRFPGVVACSEYASVNQQLCELAKDWSQVRYAD
ncbi:inositol monophosphatase family protein [Fuerstiella marisgermanici]|uniref:3'(2'),5'-bisphosphate nucleotidase n=1 Tax=Fuerstiella marisgermanici TaxID=1891926 RepID=A0A1P8W9P8_9PLAN|nr:inositol monophosphatase family protein [Fuerstiella marisgermanici]APZ90780.1 3'(2'),5'-bisphosphate nucleotidase [Fuerstiella marisgermanici]